MRAKLTKKAIALFENIKKIDDQGKEYWSSRDLWKILEYTEHRHFLPVIEKAKMSCENSGHLVSDHFEDILEMVPIGSNTERQMKSIKLSRYACYLTVQNADPSKTIVAQAQTCFAKANQTHYDVGKKVRQTIEDFGGTMPEDLPTAESIKIIETKQQKEIKD